jgi:hypothetical protein
MSTRALRSSDPLAPVRYLDVVVVVLAAPFVVLTGLPVLGYAVGAVLWIFSRILEAVLDHRARRADGATEHVGELLDRREVPVGAPPARG